MKTQNYFEWSLAYIAFLMLVSCQSSPAETEINERYFRININEDPPQLDPREVADNISAFVTRMLFEGLTRFNLKNEVELAAAQSYSLSEDKKTYTFILRPTVWSNGEPVIAQDFVKSWEGALAPQNPSGGAYNLFLIKNAKDVKEGKMPLETLGIRALDDQTLQVELEHPAPYFLELIASNYYLPVPTKHLEQNPNWNHSKGSDFISNGPFLLEKWKHNDVLLVKKNPLYWDAASVQLPGIHISMVRDQITELKMFERGELDWAGNPASGIPPEAMASLKKQEKLHMKGANSINLFMFNCDKFPFTSSKMRKAFAYALNREEITTYLLQGGQIPAYRYLPPSPNRTDKKFYKDGDVETARLLFEEGLKELGITKAELPPIVLSYNTNESHHKIAMAVQQQWRRVFDVPVVLENLEWKVYLDKVHFRDFMIGRMGYIAMHSDPIGFLESYSYLSNSLNYTGWSPKAYQDLIERAKYTTDLQEHYALLDKAEEVLMDAMPVMPIYFRTNVYLKNPQFQNELFDLTGEVDFRFAHFE